jgi:hypothetical protein
MFVTQTSNASQPLLDSYNNSDLVLVGKIISLSQVATTTSSLSQYPNQTRYDIQVEQYYKNPQQFHLVTVYGYEKGIYLSQDPTYDVGDRVFLYLHNEHGHYQIQSDSLKLDNNCDARGMIPMATLPFEPPAISSAAIGHSFYASDSKGNAPEFFLRENNVTINFDEQNILPVVKDATVELIVKTNNDTKIVMDDKKSVTVQACNGQIPMKWIFIPTIGGQYTVQVNVTGGYNFGNRYVFYSEPVVNTGFRVLENSGGPVVEKAQLVSPLKQFKSGIAAKDVTCRPGFWLVFKTSDGSPACVKTDTAYALIHRGWAKEVSQTSLHITSTVQFTPCDISYPLSNTGVAVLYMPTNSTGKICATYHNPDSPTQTSVRIFEAKDMQQMASEITTSAYPDVVPTGNSTIVYDIKTGSQAGFYGISFFCSSIPLAVGYDNQSRIILDDFPWLYKNDICLSQTNTFQITGLSGIDVKYVTDVHRG